MISNCCLMCTLHMRVCHSQVHKTHFDCLQYRLVPSLINYKREEGLVLSLIAVYIREEGLGTRL